VFPNYFIDRAKRCWKLAKSMRDRALAQAFADRANVLRSVAISLKSAAARNGQAVAGGLRLVQSKVKTLDSLRRELSQLSPGMKLALQVSDFIFLCQRDAWHESHRLAKEFECDAEFRPDGMIWFVKRQ
jgi:hypothetical protein